MPTGNKSYLFFPLILAYQPSFYSLAHLVVLVRVIALSIHSFYVPVAIVSITVLFVRLTSGFQDLRDSFLPEKSCNYSVLKITHNRSWYIYIPVQIPVARRPNLVKLHGVIDRVILPPVPTSISAILRMKASSKSARFPPRLTMSRLRLKDVATAN